MAKSAGEVGVRTFDQKDNLLRDSIQWQYPPETVSLPAFLSFIISFDFLVFFPFLAGGISASGGGGGGNTTFYSNNSL